MRLSFSSLTGLLVLGLLGGCSSYAPPADVAGFSRDQIVARMGAPETQRQVDGETRLEFPRGPFGLHTWFVYLDAAGKAVRVEQALTEDRFNQITPDMEQEEVRRRLGRPGEVQLLGRSRGVVWSYRYDNVFCQWFQVEISTDHQVRSAGYGQPPECDRRTKIIIP